jgi:hypothetical protein
MRCQLSAQRCLVIPLPSGSGDPRRYLITFEVTSKTRLRIESANHRRKADKRVA